MIEWEKVSLQLWEELCKESEVIFDVGSNTGVYSLLAKSSNPKSKVYAFEPIKRISALLNLFLSSFATSRAGNTWPAVPPPAITTFSMTIFLQTLLLFSQRETSNRLSNDLVCFLPGLECVEPCRHPASPKLPESLQEDARAAFPMSQTRSIQILLARHSFQPQGDL